MATLHLCKATSMAEDFLSALSESTPVDPDQPSSAKRDREPVRIMLVGSKRGITNIIYSLYTKDFAEIYEWSKPEPELNSGKWISLATKYVSLD